METRIFEYLTGDKFYVWSVDEKRFLLKSAPRDTVIDWYKEQDDVESPEYAEELLNSIEAGENPYDEGVTSYQEAHAIWVSQQDANKESVAESDIVNESEDRSLWKKLFPTWSNPGVLAALIGARFVLNVGLTLLTVSAAGVRTLMAGAVTGLTVVIPLIAVQSIRPGPLGDRASDLELLGQLVLLVLTGFVVYAYFSWIRLFAFLMIGAAAGYCWFASIAMYGERFQAP